MSGGWQFILNQTSVESLLGCKARHREALIRALEALAANPYQRGDWVAKVSTGRPVQITQVDGFLITFWVDSFVREIRIINLERI